MTNDSKMIEQNVQELLHVLVKIQKQKSSNPADSLAHSTPYSLTPTDCFDSSNLYTYIDNALDFSKLILKENTFYLHNPISPTEHLGHLLQNTWLNEIKKDYLLYQLGLLYKMIHYNPQQIR